MPIKLPKWLIHSTSDLKFHMYPFFLWYKPNHLKVKGPHVREVINNIKIGDILLRRFDGYLNTYLTPGFWGHAAVCDEDDLLKQSVIHAVGEGVIREDILTFCRCDSICVLRVKDSKLIDSAIKYFIEAEKNRVGYDYDYMDKNGKLYCTELVNEGYNHIFNDDMTQVYGRKVLTPDRIHISKEVDIVVNIVNY